MLYKEEKMKTANKTYLYIKSKLKPETLDKICEEFTGSNRKSIVAGEYMQSYIQQSELLYKLQNRLVMKSNIRESLEAESLSDILNGRNPQFINDILEMFNYNTYLYRVHVTSPEVCPTIMQEGLLIQEPELDYTSTIIDDTDENLLLSLFNDTHMFQEGMVVIEAKNSDITKMSYPGSEDYLAFRAELPAQFIKGYIDIANEKVVFNPAFKDRKLFPTGREIVHETVEDFHAEELKKYFSDKYKEESIDIRSLGKEGLDVWRSKILPSFEPLSNTRPYTDAQPLPYWLEKQREDIVTLLQIIGEEVPLPLAEIKITDRHKLLTEVYARNKIMAEKIREALWSKRK